MNLVGLSQDEMEGLAGECGEKPYRGRQLYRQIFARKVLSLEQMSDLPGRFRESLESRGYTLAPLPVENRWDSRDGTVKFLFRLEDGRCVESVYIPERKRDTLCISSQVGCAVGCTFCLTAQMGFKRNLTPGEIVGQVLSAIHHSDLAPSAFNIVFMGMGEPLYNYRNVMKAFRLLIDSQGMDLSHRKITISTSGVVPVLKKLAEEEVIPNLAISLNSTTEDVRDQIMPINKKWSMRELLDFCRRFSRQSDRWITFEYVLLAGVTDSDEDARRLVRLLRGIRSKVNLIPYNPNPGLPHSRPTQMRIDRFKEILQASHVSAFLRTTRGDDISAACGQLAHFRMPQGRPTADSHAGAAS